ncbi:Potassium uptake protein [Bifidobacterium saguini DSM 23967]|uniref:Probable potassium transport system protein Kup n=2 Tax=Bifidobacterium saguini TaxID=762210 RepID=A0A087D6G3_9BIFI|nr:KUP/HAK/KT family potassium transporter [Bifidobacterium saguini]KFI91113.1 Potassium uptake protein [Bifidobacterium saguini DSM 23967]QTB90042.1 KUP/HAK/KT family potassium transporter [Bifidobacterium saguini]
MVESSKQSSRARKQTQAESANKQAKQTKQKPTNTKRAAATQAEQTAIALKKEEAALLRADTYTNAPKVSRRTLTREEREALAKQREAEDKEAEKLASTAAKGRIGRWWARLQSGPNKITWSMAIVALGVVYGDIGTSPLYTAQTFLSGQGGLGNVDRAAVLGMLSLVFWSITLITTVKYVLIAMKIDNNGEGGIFALYSLIRRYGAWLAIPAMLGGAAFLADSVLTPAVSISSAVEGLQTLPPLEQLFDDNPSLTLMITVVIIVVLFSVQSRGTESIGRVFGSIVLVWFSFLAVVGLFNLSNDWTVFEALNPVYGIQFLFSPHNAAGIALMGTVFLSTTGAEALYSDMGHVGRGNIYFTWPFIKVALVCNYFGQGAWMLANSRNPEYNTMKTLNPFFQMMTPNVRYVAVVLSVTAGVIASQALITGAFTMVSEATRLNWMPHLQVRYPARTRGQLYIPVVNGVLCVSTLLVLAIFKDSEHISAAYGLALTITMITTTVLLAVYIWHDGHRFGAVLFTVVFLAIQIMFFVASMAKFLHGGWFTMLLTLAILFVMYTWNEGTKLERAQRRHMRKDDFLPALDKLHGDFRIPYFADNIVYLTSDSETKRLDTDIFFSIFADHPKRARAWWAVSVETTDEPFTREYSVENFGTNYLFRVRFRLGFKVSQSIPAYIHQIMHDLSKTGELPKQQSLYPKVDADPDIGTIRYVLIHKALMPESKVSARGALSLQAKYAIRHMAGSPVKWFGLAPYNPLVEVQPLFVSTRRPPRLKRTDAPRVAPVPSRHKADPAAIPDPLDTTVGLGELVKQVESSMEAPEKRPVPKSRTKSDFTKADATAVAHMTNHTTKKNRK